MTGYSFIRTIVKDPDHPGEMLLDLGEEICKRLAWHEGDVLDWTDHKDGTWTVRKKKTQNTTTSTKS